MRKNAYKDFSGIPLPARHTAHNAGPSWFKGGAGRPDPWGSCKPLDDLEDLEPEPTVILRDGYRPANYGGAGAASKAEDAFLPSQFFTQRRAARCVIDSLRSMQQRHRR
jgi:hypothetical protein